MVKTYWELCIYNSSTVLWCVSKNGRFMPLLPGIPFRPYRFRSRQGAVNAYNKWLEESGDTSPAWQIRIQETEDT